VEAVLITLVDVEAQRPALDVEGGEDCLLRRHVAESGAVPTLRRLVSYSEAVDLIVLLVKQIVPVCCVPVVPL
jgi:hypothetical protein